MKIIRRIILFLAIILSVLWIEAVYADMSGPEMSPIEVVVIAPEGVDYYTFNGEVAGHLNKGDIVYIVYEYSGSYVLGVKETGTYGGEYTKSIGDVESLEGLSVVKEVVDPTSTEDNSIFKYDTPQIAKINAVDGVDVYAGPSDVYEKVGHIKNGVQLTYKYSAASTHIYVEYDGVKGWVEILDGNVLVQNDMQYIFRTDVVTECGTIPKNSITTPVYKTDRWTHKAVFEYNNCEFMHNTMKDEKVIGFYPTKRVANRDITLYEYADKTGSVLATIPKDAEIISIAEVESYYGDEVDYVEYNGVRGWIVEDTRATTYASQVDIPDVDVEDTIVVEKPEVNDVITPSGNSSTTKKMGLNTFILLCAFGVSLLVITALVIIILVNRSKAAKKEVKVDKEEK